MGGHYKNIQLILVLYQSSILHPTLFLLYINYLYDDITCNIAICADNTTLYSKYDWTSNLGQQL